MFTKRLRLGLAGALLLIPVTVSIGQISSTAESRLNTQRSLTARVLGSVPSARTANVQYAVDRITRDAWDGQDWEIQSKTEHTYTGFRRSATHDYQWSPSGWIPSVRTSFYENGLIRTIESWDPVSQTPMPLSEFYYEFAYDLTKSRQLVSLEIEREWDGAAWQNRSRTTYEMLNDPTHGLMVIGGQTDYWAAGEWSQVERFSFYEADGAVFQEYRTWDGVSWVNADRVVFPDQTIVSLGNRIEVLAARYGEFSDLYLATLLIPANFTQDWTGSAWENSYRLRVEAYHFASGEPAVIRFETWEGGDWVGELGVEFNLVMYNNSSAWRVNRSSLHIPTDNGWAPISVEDYDYDGRNLLAESVRRDGLFGIFQNTSRISFNWIGLSVGREDPGSVPVTHVLHAAYPNPFNPTTTLAYELATSDAVRLELRDMLGRLVEVLVDEEKPAGTHKVLIQASELPSGIYAVRMLTPGRVQTQLLTLVK